MLQRTTHWHLVVSKLMIAARGGRQTRTRAARAVTRTGRPWGATVRVGTVSEVTGTSGQAYWTEVRVTLRAASGSQARIPGRLPVGY